jgi:hypothetical protein
MHGLGIANMRVDLGLPAGAGWPCSGAISESSVDPLVIVSAFLPLAFRARVTRAFR